MKKINNVISLHKSIKYLNAIIAANNGDEKMPPMVNSLLKDVLSEVMDNQQVWDDCQYYKELDACEEQTKQEYVQEIISKSEHRLSEYQAYSLENHNSRIKCNKQPAFILKYHDTCDTCHDCETCLDTEEPVIPF